MTTPLAEAPCFPLSVRTSAALPGQEATWTWDGTTAAYPSDDARALALVDVDVYRRLAGEWLILSLRVDGRELLGRAGLPAAYLTPDEAQPRLDLFPAPIPVGRGVSVRVLRCATPPARPEPRYLVLGRALLRALHLLEGPEPERFYAALWVRRDGAGRDAREVSRDEGRSVS